jgi:hypothetical protein
MSGNLPIPELPKLLTFTKARRGGCELLHCSNPPRLAKPSAPRPASPGHQDLGGSTNLPGG